MGDFFSRAVGTVFLRPYVFIFLIIFILAGFSQIGWKKTFLFLLVGYFTAFVSEVLSIHNGFPYGLYHYIETTRNRELWVAGVPLMDSLSYVFLAYCSYSTALFIFSPIYRHGKELFILDTSSLRCAWRTLLLSAFLMTFLDVVIDPVALQGSRWFLGQIYYYPKKGLYFGVPMSNFYGWFLVAGTMIFFLQKIISIKFFPDSIDRIFSRLPWGSFLGVFLYLGVLVFNTGISYLIKEFPLAIVNTFYILLFLALCYCFVQYKLERANSDDLKRHIREFPGGRLAVLMGERISMEDFDGGKNIHAYGRQGEDGAFQRRKG